MAKQDLRAKMILIIMTCKKSPHIPKVYLFHLLIQITLNIWISWVVQKIQAECPKAVLLKTITVGYGVQWIVLFKFCHMCSFLWISKILIKFIYSENAAKFCKTSTLDLSYVVTVKSTVEISQTFVAFSEYMNFTKY